MAVNKNALIRYQVLDKCFRNPGRKYFWEDLLEACNTALSEYNGPKSKISRRQLFEDMLFLESEAGGSVPLERFREGKRVYYRYSDLSFSINNQPLNEYELNLLQSGMTILSRFKGIPQIEALSDIFIRLQKGSSPTNVGDIVGFDENPFLTGLDHLGELLNSILYQKVLKIDYQNFKSQDSYFLELHPYYLKQYNKRWFVFGFNPTMDKMDWNLALDRIKTIEQISTPYKPNDQIVWEEYFEDIVGVTRPQDGKVQKIELWVDPETVPYIVTKPIHGSQKKLESETEGLTIQLNLIPNFEFYQLILSYGDRVKILAPKETQDHISKLLKRALDLYFL